MVRLKPGVSIARAQADLDVVARDLADTYADDKGRGVQLSELWRAPSSGGPAVVAVMVIQLERRRRRPADRVRQRRQPAAGAAPRAVNAKPLSG